jgi:hypothetical protein
VSSTVVRGSCQGGCHSGTRHRDRWITTPRIPFRPGLRPAGTLMWMGPTGLSISPWISAAVSWLSAAPDPAHSTADQSFASLEGSPVNVA